MSTIIGGGLESYLQRQVRRRALDTIAEAREQAEALRRETDERIAALRARAAAETQAAVTARERRVVAQARLRARLLLAERREALLQDLWSDADERLRALAQAAPERRLALLGALLADALTQLGAGPIAIAVSAADAPLLTPEVLSSWRADFSLPELDLTNEPFDGPGGLRVRRLDANRLVDNAYSERLALVQRTQRDAIGRLLGGEDGDGREG